MSIYLSFHLASLVCPTSFRSLSFSVYLFFLGFAHSLFVSSLPTRREQDSNLNPQKWELTGQPQCLASDFIIFLSVCLILLCLSIYSYIFLSQSLFMYVHICASVIAPVLCTSIRTTLNLLKVAPLSLSITYFLSSLGFLVSFICQSIHI